MGELAKETNQQCCVDNFREDCCPHLLRPAGRKGADEMKNSHVQVRLRRFSRDRRIRRHV
jgi:hypothetical protein